MVQLKLVVLDRAFRPTFTAEKNEVEKSENLINELESFDNKKYRFAVVKDNVMTITYSNSFWVNLLSFLKNYFHDPKHSYFFNKNINNCIRQLSAKELPPQSSATHEVAKQRLSVSEPAPKLSPQETSIARPTPVASTTKAARPQVSYDEIRKQLLKEKYTECTTGILPPFAISGMIVSLKPPTMDITQSPNYIINLEPKPQREYLIHLEVSSLPPEKQIAYFLDLFKQQQSHLESRFQAAKKAYDEAIGAAWLIPGTDIYRIEPSKLRALDLSHTYTEFVRNDPKVYLDTLRQIAKKYSLQHDFRKELEEAVQIRHNLRDCELCLLEASDYVSNYLSWLDMPSNRRTTIPPIQETPQKTITYGIEDLNDQTLKEIDQRYDCRMKIDRNILKMTPHDNVKVTVSKLTPEGSWELVPIFIRTYSHYTRYDVECPTQPDQIYRLDFTVVGRKAYDAFSRVQTESVKSDTLFIQT